MDLTLRPTKKQHKAWQKLEDGETKYLLFGGGAGGGKSWLGCEWLITKCIQYPDTKWFIGRHELSRLMKSSYITFQKVCKFHGIHPDLWKYNGQYNYIEFTNGSRIDLLDVAYKPSDPMYQRFGSLEYTGGWLEEVGEIDFGAFDILKTRIGRHKNKEYELMSKILMTCNPNKGWTYREIYKPWKESKLPKQYAFIQSLYNDNPHTAKEYQDNLSQVSDKATKERLMYGNWEFDDDPSNLIKYDAILDLFTNTVSYSEDLYLVGDIARYGADRTILTLWKGLECFDIRGYEKQGLDQTADAIELLAKEHKIPYSHILVDEDGVGGGVVDRLRGIKGFMANRRPINDKNTHKPENYQNLKAQCGYLLADYINDRKMKVSTDKMRVQLIEELEQIKRKDMDREIKLQLSPKEKVKELLGRSPDISDCFMMRMYLELKPSNSPVMSNRKKAVSYFRR